jgi:hypothetical protein
MLAAVTAMVQEKMKDPPKSGHEGMAKPAAAQCDAAVIAKATSAAPADIGRNAVIMGAGADGKMKERRAGTNGWMACSISPATRCAWTKSGRPGRSLDDQKGAAEADDGRRGLHAQGRQGRK